MKKNKKDNPTTEHFITVYNADFDEEYSNHLTAMDTFVYVTMKLMAGNPYGMDVLYVTPDSICTYALNEDATEVPQRFTRELRESLKRIAENGYFPHISDRRQTFDTSVFRKKDLTTNWKVEKATLIPISAYKKIFQAFELSEIAKVKIFYFYVKLSMLIGYYTGVCTYSLDVIAEKTGVCKKTVQAYIRTLEAYKVLAVYHMGRNVKCYANFPTNVLGQYYNREKVLQCGQDTYYSFCSRNKIKQDLESDDRGISA